MISLTAAGGSYSNLDLPAISAIVTAKGSDAAAGFLLQLGRYNGYTCVGICIFRLLEELRVKAALGQSRSKPPLILVSRADV